LKALLSYIILEPYIMI